MLDGSFKSLPTVRSFRRERTTWISLTMDVIVLCIKNVLSWLGKGYAFFLSDGFDSNFRPKIVFIIF